MSWHLEVRMEMKTTMAVIEKQRAAKDVRAKVSKNEAGKSF